MNINFMEVGKKIGGDISPAGETAAGQIKKSCSIIAIRNKNSRAN
jgi:hypothetical protein